MTKPVIGVTVGDPAGIGPEIVLDAVTDPRVTTVCDPVVFGDPDVLRRCGEATGKEAAGVRLVPVAATGPIEPGVVSAAAGRNARDTLTAACAAAERGTIAGIATAPIHKGALRAAGIDHIGHTELLGDHFGVDDPLTMFVTGPMRIFFFTRHLSLRQAIDAISADRIEAFVRRVDHALRGLGIATPRIGLAALNPHAGDDGQFGDEEQRHLIPAATRCRAAGIDVSDPIGADSVFHQALEGTWDGVASLYHDQGHIAAKTRDFYGTVTATLGLPVPRTSVDHGTAFDIAWGGVANSLGLVKAIELCAELA